MPSRLLSSLVLPCLLIAGDAPAQDAIVVNARPIHLGTPDEPEWEWFEKDPARGGRLDLKFSAHANAAEATLFLRQDDVKLEWPLELNGRRLGKLFLMEADLVHAVALPAGLLREGENVLSVIPPIGEGDDIVLREITIDPRPVTEAVGEVHLNVRVKNSAHTGLPARLTIVDEHGTLTPLVAAPGQNLAVRPGVAYTGNGAARLGLRAGKYTVYASRGFEYSVASETFEAHAGDTRELVLQLRREVPTPGWVACDTHIHTLTLSGHGDSTLEERMLTIVGEGIELPIATEHNRHADYTEAARRMGVSAWFTPVTGNEVTTPAGHFNVFPVAPEAVPPDANVTDWPALMQSMRALPGSRVIILNHPRSLHSKFIPFAPENFDAATGENKRGPDFTFDALEVLNSGAQQTDYRLAINDWLALLNRGKRIVAVGASDSHDVSRFIVGQSRTYLAVQDGTPGRIPVDEACTNLLAGRAVVSMGLLPQITVEDRFGIGDLATGLPEQIHVRVRVLGPAWVTASKVELLANGKVIQQADIPAAEGQKAGEKFTAEWTLPRPARDTHLVVLATGPAVTAPFWAMTRPYQPKSRQWTGRAIGLTNPVWLDTDGDGRFTVR